MREHLAILGLAFLLTVASPGAEADEAAPGWLGVFLGQERAGSNDATLAPGVPVHAVVAGSPAERAGLRARDRILSVDAVAVASSRELIGEVSGKSPGSWINLRVERGDDELQLSARLAERPGDPRKLSVRKGWIGVEAIDLPESLREHFGAPAEAGVMLSGVLEGSPAEIGGLEVGDVVFQISGEPVGSTGALRGRVATGGVGNTVEIKLMRNGSQITAEATVAAAPAREEKR